MKRMVLTILLITLMMVIFLFSNQNATVSQGVSDKVTTNIIDTITSITNRSITNDEKQNLIKNTRTIIRKTAHFTLYFILGIISFMTIASYNFKKPILYSIIFCLLYACGDEIHQLFLDGRTPKIIDVLIDTIGSSLSIIMVSKLNFRTLKLHLYKDNKI